MEVQMFTLSFVDGAVSRKVKGQGLFLVDKSQRNPYSALLSQLVRRTKVKDKCVTSTTIAKFLEGRI